MLNQTNLSSEIFIEEESEEISLGDRSTITTNVSSISIEPNSPNSSTRHNRGGSQNLEVSTTNIENENYRRQQHKAMRDLRRASYSVRIISVFYWLFGVFSYIRDWRLVFTFGFLFNIVGFYGAHTYNRRLIFIYMCWVAVDVIFQVIYLIIDTVGETEHSPLTFLLTIVIVAFPSYFVYYLYLFYMALPRSGIRTFQQLRADDMNIPMNNLVIGGGRDDGDGDGGSGVVIGVGNADAV
eukprot:TRINITY_DN3227_c0_g1_i1.p1 TRINITY_DN3227_c0_g1~~TRINITY_DN3227_c0_g1_i1.p1  ORF type:complete len:239 (+),score=37.85 TRINITY_DN3227_c0_g1_i1:221-937(+)